MSGIRKGQITGLMLAFLLTTAVMANPTGGQVAAGAASIEQGPGTTVINQTSQRAVINWQSFNIGSGELTQFVQPNSSSMALNRISPTQGASQIFGTLKANGQVILINPAGIYFAPGSYVNVGGLIATTTNISNENFMAGHFVFNDPTSFRNAAISNAGTIIAAQHGLVALVGPNVTNSGMIQANLGKVALASGDTFTVGFAPDGLVNFAMNGSSATGGGSVTNTGSLIANGGTVLVSAQQASQVLDNVINLGGVVEARSIYQKNGEVIISGDPNAGVVSVAANIDVSGPGKGGTVNITGHDIWLQASANINASGDLGGGQVNVGGNAHGAGPLPNAYAVQMDKGASIKADAITAGDGGQVVLWSQGAWTLAYGDISAKAGSDGGNGGFIETSGHDLDVYGLDVNTSAPHGITGTWLLDPYDVTISSSADFNGFFGSFSCGGACIYFAWNATGTGSNILNTDIQSRLATNQVSIYTTASGQFGVENGDITVNAPITWTSNQTLLFGPDNNLYLNAPITGTNGTLRIGNGNNGTIGSIIPNSSASIDVANFSLEQGSWIQVGSLASFTVSNNFQLNYANVPNSGSLAASFIRASSGDGSSGNPYVIQDVYGLQGIGSTPATLADYWQLGTNINAAGTSSWAQDTFGLVVPTSPGSGFQPIGNSSMNFTGSFDGQGFSISNLVINAPSANQVGLFGQTGSAASIANITVANPTITGSANVGGLVGLNGGSISNASVTASSSSFIVSGTGSSGFSSGASGTGGLVGRNTGTITNSSSTVYVVGGSNTGGLVGINSGGTIQATGSGIVFTSGGTVSGVDQVGGLVGLMYSGSLTSAGLGQVYSSSNVSDTSGDSGGLLGSNLANIAPAAQGYITASGNVTSSSFGHAYVGGFVGDNEGNLTNVGATGTVSAPNAGWVGGFAGFNLGTLTNVYATGDVTGHDTVGGLVGENEAPITSTGTTGGHGLTYYAGGTVSGNFTVGGLVGHNDDVINSPAQGYITATGTLVGLVNQGTEFGGLVGYADGFGVISNVTNTINITNMPNNYIIGGIVGLNQGKITNVYNKGNISGDDEIGGIVGEQTTGFGTSVYSISNAYNSGTITGGTDTVFPTDGHVGGIAGWVVSNGQSRIDNVYNTGDVLVGSTATPNAIGGVVGFLGRNNQLTNAYNSGRVSGGSGGTNVGGIVGEAELNSLAASYTIGYWYNTGYVSGASGVGGLIGSVDNTNNPNFVGTSYFNSDTSGPASLPAVSNWSDPNLASLTRSQMMDSSNFSGWDFSGVWDIIANTSYPYLRAFYTTTPRVITATSTAAGTPVSLYVGGISFDSTSTGYNGDSYFLEGNNQISKVDNTVADGATVYAFFNQTSPTVSNAIALAPTGGGQMGFSNALTLTANTLTVGLLSTSEILSNTTLNSAVGGDTHALFTLSGNNLIMNSGDSFVVTSPTTYSVVGNLTTSSGGTINIAGSVAGGGNALLITTGSGTSTISGVMSNLTGFTYAGNGGTLILSGANNYSGATNINGGTLQAGAANTLSPNSDISIANVAGASLDFNNFSFTIPTLNGGAASSLSLGSATLTISGGGSYAGTISGSGGLDITGGTLTLSGNSNYTGTTTVDAGTLVVASANGLGSTAGGTVVNTGAALTISGVNVGNESVSLSDASLNGTGTSGLAGPVALNGSSDFINALSGTFTLSGALTGNANLILNGPGIVRLTDSGNNTYSGTTNINGGTLQAGAANTLSTTSAIVLANVAGASLDLNNFNFTAPSLNGGGASGGDLSLGSSILTISGGGSYAGTISGSGGLDITGGTFTLSGSNNYTGTTTVDAGTLVVANAGGLGSTAGGTVVNAGAALTISGVNVGNESVTLNDATLNGAGTAGLAGPVTLGSGTSDVIDANSGTFTLSGAIDGNASLTLQGAGNLVLASNIGSGTPLSSLMVNTLLNLGSSVFLSANSISINNGVTGGGNDLALNGNSISLTGAVTVNNLNVTGTGINNSFSLDDSNPHIFTVTGPNISTMTTSGITGSVNLSNVQSFTGGTSANQYLFTGNGSISGTVNGNGGLLDFSGYGSPVTDTLSADKFAGTVVSNGSTIFTYTNIVSLIGTGAGSLLILTPEQLSQAVSTGSLSGYIGDPVFWSGFTVNFPVSSPLPDVDISSIMQQPSVNNESDLNANLSNNVGDNLDALTASAYSMFDDLTNVKINPYCYQAVN